jgi:DNA-binding beta-propeller fold protein YncE
MLAVWLTTLTIVAARQAPPAACSLAGASVEAHWTGTIPQAPTAAAPLQLVADLLLPGSASRFDYQSLDSTTGRLFISHMGTGQLVVFDVRAGRVIGNLDGFPTVTGVLAVPAEHRAYASAAGDHAVVVVDDSTLQIVARVPGPRFPDGIAYAPAERRVFVSDESGRRDFVIDAATNAVVAQIELGGAAVAHSVAVDPRTHRVYLPLAHVGGRPVLRVLTPSDSH